MIHNNLLRQIKIIDTHHSEAFFTRCLVLDEADRLLDMGYEKDVAAIVKAIEDHKKAATYDPIALMKQSIKKKIGSDDEVEESDQNVTKEITDVKHGITEVMLSKRRQTVLLSATLTKVSGTYAYTYTMCDIDLSSCF